MTIHCGNSEKYIRPVNGPLFILVSTNFVAYQILTYNRKIPAEQRTHDLLDLEVCGLKRGECVGRKGLETQASAFNPEVEGSNPSPATINLSESTDSDRFSFIFITLPNSLFKPFSSDPNRDPYETSER